MKYKPITVLMVVKNGLPFLADAVNSILAQSYTDFNFLIVDDHSTDASVEYLKSISDGRLYVMKNRGNGISQALNTGLNSAESKYCAIMDADDISHPLRIEKQFSFLEENPDYVLTGTSLRYIGSDISSRSWDVDLPSEHYLLANALAKGFYVISHPTIMVRTSAMKVINGYNKDLKYNIDLDLYLRLIEHGRFTNLDGIRTSVRLHENSFTHLNLQSIVKQNYLYSRKKEQNYNNADKLIITLKYYSAFNYRKGLLKFLSGHWITWSWNLFLAALFDMPRAFFHLKNKYHIK